MNIVSKAAEDTCETKNQNGFNSSNTSASNPPQATTTSSGQAELQTIDVAALAPNDQSLEPSIEKFLEDEAYPEGGARAWSVVFGSFCAGMIVFGVINSTAVFQQYLSMHQLSEYSPGQVGWIFSIALFLTFFCGVQVGPIFDAKGPRVLILCGSILYVLSMMLLGECTKYWHFIMVYSVLSGIAGALVNTPALASVGHFFLVKRGNATGIVVTSGSIGGVIFPIMLQKLIPLVGFAWTTRILGFIILILAILANLFIRSRLPRTKFENVWPDFTVFKDLSFAFCTLGIFFMEWGLFVPLAYISSYSITHGQSTAFSFEVVAMFNGGSFFGRWAPGFFADKLGRYNTVIATISLCILFIFSLWLPAGDSEAMIIAFAVCFGFASGSNLSLTPVCVGQLCKTENYGRYYGTCYTIVSLGTLTGVPIAGQILSSSSGSYTGLMLFAGIAYIAALICFVISRAARVGMEVFVVW